MIIALNFPKSIFRFLYFLSLSLCVPTLLGAQCTNSTQFPLNNVALNIYNETVTLSNNSFAGQYIKITGFPKHKTLIFTSSNPNDNFTICDKNNSIYKYGATPLSFGILDRNDIPDTITLHINLQSPACGIEAIARTISVNCLNCEATPALVGVGTATATTTLEVNGEIKIGNVVGSPRKGMIKWNNSTRDFEGYNGIGWISLTQPNSSWGLIRSPVINENHQLIASDGASSDLFGYSVSMAGDYAIIGAYAANGSGTDEGAAYIFVRSGNNWIQQAKLVAGDAAANDKFGYSVAITNDYAIVSAYADDIGTNTDQGSAYVFARSGESWTQQAKLVAGDGALSDFFGYSVALSGDYALVGAYNSDVAAKANQGAAYVFVRSGNTWTQQSKLVANDGAESDLFGSSVTLSGTYAIVGAPNDNINGNSLQGSAYVFLRAGTSWTQQAKLLAADGAASDNFGSSVSISNDYAIVGAAADDNVLLPNQGSAYIFLRSGTNWNQQTKLVAGDGTGGDYFGNSVSIYGDYAIVGALSKGSSFSSQGAAYIFARSGTVWNQQAKLLASDAAAIDNFGSSVSMWGNYIIVGANNDDINTITNQGSAYIIIKN